MVLFSSFWSRLLHNKCVSSDVGREEIGRGVGAAVAAKLEIAGVKELEGGLGDLVFSNAFNSSAGP